MYGKWIIAMFVNMMPMHSVCFYFINTTVMYKFTTLLEFIYIIPTDMLCTVPFNSLNLNCYSSFKWLKIRDSCTD